MNLIDYIKIPYFTEYLLGRFALLPRSASVDARGRAIVLRI